MKPNGFPTTKVMIILASILVVASLYVNSQKKSPSDDMKSQLTESNEGEKAPSAKPKGLKAIFAKNLEKQEEMVERTEFNDDSLVTRERVYTEKEINEMTEAQFSDLLKETELRLPVLADIKKLPPAALHRTPAPVIQAGRDLGLIKEVLKVHESYDRVASGFYQTCAKNSERPTPVRALCLTNLIQIKNKTGEKINKAEYPSELVELTKIVTDL